MINQRVIDSVEFRRDQYGLSVQDWAWVIGSSQSHYSEFVNGLRELSKKQAALCFKYGVPPEVLFNDEGRCGYPEIEKLLKARDQA